MKKVILFLLILFLYNPASAKHQYLEKEYQAEWCKAKSGMLEYTLPDKARIDCLLPDMAIEFDFAPKWAECIGQALYYSAMTERAPACVLIIEKKGDLKYVNRLNKAIENITPFYIFTTTPAQLTR